MGGGAELPPVSCLSVEPSVGRVRRESAEAPITPKALIEPARHAGTALLRSQTDARLVDLTREGNERAFEAIVQRYRGPLMRYCSRLLSASRAEDAVQGAFLSAHRAIHAGDAELNLRPWLYRIAHNASLNLLRQHGYDHDEVSEEIDGVETPPQAFERGERLRTVVAAVQELPDRQRNAIVLQAVEGRSYDEIASELGVTDGAVRQLLNRARNTLREAAAALTPTGLLARIGSSVADAPVAERVAQTVAGAGGGALLAKAGATLVVAGALAGGAATGALPGTGARDGGKQGVAAAVTAPVAAQSGGSGPRARVALTNRDGSSSGTAADTLRGGNGGPGGHGGGGGGSSQSGQGDRHGGNGSGDNSSGSGDSHSGGGSHSGSDSGSGGGDHSGSGGGDGGDSSGSGDSGSGSGSGDSGSGGGGSGSGDAGALDLNSGSSGSDSSGSGTSGSGTSGSGTSGSGSGSSDDLTTSNGSGHDRSGSDDTPDLTGDLSGTSH